MGKYHQRYSSALCEELGEAVGEVPIVRLHRVTSVCKRVDCYVKLESCQPGGSIKEKNAVFLVNQAELAGELGPGGTIIESSSGNFGVALAMIGAARDYRVVIVVDTKTTPTFRRLLKAYGAELVEVSEVDSSGSMQKARITKATEIAENTPGGWYPCQHYNPRNPDVHTLLTAREIERAFDGRLDALVVGVSTGGQLSGLARYLKPRYPDLMLVGVDVQGSVIFDPDSAPYKMTGIGLSFRPPNLDYQAIHSAYIVPENLAYSMCHALAQHEGLLLGSSSGAIISAGLHFAQSLPSGARICMINPDHGNRYLETIYDEQWLSKNDFTLIPAEHVDVAVEQLCLRESFG